MTTTCHAQRWRRRPQATPDGSDHPCPACPRNCGWTSTRTAGPATSWSGFMPRHIEQPAWRHCAPAAVKISPRPSDSACARTRIEPGTISIRTPSATLRPRRTSATTRRSSILSVGARPDENGVHRDVTHRRSGPEIHVRQRFFGRLALCVVEHQLGVGDRTRQRHTLPGIGAPRDERTQRRGVEVDLGVEFGALVSAQSSPRRDRCIPVGDPSARADARAGIRT